MDGLERRWARTRQDASLLQAYYDETHPRCQRAFHQNFEKMSETRSAKNGQNTNGRIFFLPFSVLARFFPRVGPREELDAWAACGDMVARARPGDEVAAKDPASGVLDGAARVHLTSKIECFHIRGPVDARAPLPPAADGSRSCGVVALVSADDFEEKEEGSLHTTL